ncbi:MAG: hypothetical protein DHS20C15_19510 [Planctomycetota bacterium]|nr:MAG: hypothetical protein DHS20C15_19510 [Planctomycetota bacterium]
MASKQPVPQRVARNPLVFVCGLAAVFVLAVAGLPDASDAPRDSTPRAVREAPVVPTALERVDSSERDQRNSMALPRALDARPEMLRVEQLRRPDLAAANNPDKKIAKLQKKIMKKEANVLLKEEKIAQAEADALTAQSDLAAAQTALMEAEALPQSTPAEIKARKKAIKAANKALKKAQKQINKLAKKVSKLETKVGKLEETIDNIEQTIEDITVGGLPDPGSSNVAGLKLPSRMSVVSTKVAEVGAGEGGGSGFFPGLGLGGGSFAGDFPALSDFATDESHAFVYDPSMDALESVNSILCQIQQTAYQFMVNEGAYLAQINEVGCREGVEVDEGVGSESASQADELSLWTVASVRSSDESEHVVGVWVPEDGGDDDAPGEDPEGPAHIHARMAILEGVTEANPFGVFEMDFALYLDEDTEQDDPMFIGTLESGSAEGGNLHFDFYEQQGNPNDPIYSLRQVSVTMTPDGTTGVAHVREEFTDVFGGPAGGSEEFVEEYLLAFDEGNLLRGEVLGDTVCLNREEFSTNVWRYNLYHAEGELAGQRVKRNSGFPIKTEGGEHGWAGYWGIELHGPDDLTDGQTVLKETFGEPGDDPAEEYTVVQAPGKLFEFRREELDLESLDGAKFEWWEFPFSESPGPPPQPVRWQVEYDHANGLWFKLALFDEQEQSFVPEANPSAINREEYPWLDLYSNALGGSVNNLDGDDFVTFFSERVINGSDDAFGEGTQLDLVGYFDALDAGITGTEAEGGDIFLPEAYELEEGYSYRFLKDDLGLYVDLDDGGGFQAVGLADGEDYQSGPFEWGMRSGPMVPASVMLDDVYDIWDQEVVYVYETGPNSWNRYSALRNGEGEFVNFEPPLQFTYTHNVDNDLNDDESFAGQSYAMGYGGSGDLWGIPFEGFDIDGDGNPDRWYPQFSLADGALMGPTGSEYVVRAIELEQRLLEDEQGCTELSIADAQALSLPSENGYQEPNIGSKPEVTESPAVIEGEVQGDDE